MKRYIPLLLPLLLGGAATMTDFLPFKMGVPLVCAAIIGFLISQSAAERRVMVWLVAALLFSAVGDFFLSNKSGNASYFVIGIGLYFLAHIGYLAFGLRQGRMHWLGLGVLLLIFVPYFVWFLNPAIDDPILSAAVLLYLLISCAAFAATFGMSTAQPVKGLYVAALFFILFSDTIISFTEFLSYRELNSLILPTYYLAHLLITAGMLHLTAPQARTDRVVAAHQS